MSPSTKHPTELQQESTNSVVHLGEKFDMHLGNEMCSLCPLKA